MPISFFFYTYRIQVKDLLARHANFEFVFGGLAAVNFPVVLAAYEAIVGNYATETIAALM